ncbi:MAG: hypothetical protein JXR23_00675 [Pontiellaceae bacterium]|nr:hypothetical protein [Pontiellaceae bacterium]
MNKSTWLDHLNGLDKKHPEVGGKVLTACSNNLLPMDSFSIAVLDRSLHNLAGFICLLKGDNGQCAMVILRAQLDTLLRYSAHQFFDDPHDFAGKVFGGTPIRDLKNPGDNKCLSDRYLKDKLGVDHGWIPDLYDTCCAFAHLSNSHTKEFLSRCGNVDQVSGERNIVISKRDHLSDDYFVRFANAFTQVTTLLLNAVSDWAARSPELALKFRERYPVVFKKEL